MCVCLCVCVGVCVSVCGCGCECGCGGWAGKCFQQERKAPEKVQRNRQRHEVTASWVCAEELQRQHSTCKGPGVGRCLGLQRGLWGWGRMKGERKERGQGGPSRAFLAPWQDLGMLSDKALSPSLQALHSLIAFLPTLHPYFFFFFFFWHACFLSKFPSPTPPPKPLQVQRWILDLLRHKRTPLYLFVCCLFVCFLGLHVQHIEVPRPRV